MDNEILSFINLYNVLAYMQTISWNTLPGGGSSVLNNLNQRQIKALMNVFIQEKNNLPPLSLNQLAERLGMKKAACSLLVSDLVNKKFLRRLVDEENRKFVKILPGAKFRQLAENVAENAIGNVAKVLDILSPEERKSLVSTSDKLFKAYLNKVGGIAKL